MAAYLISWLPVLDQVVLFDGNSTDGTLEIIQAIKKEHRYGDKIVLITDKDPKDLRDDYVRVFNECMNSLNTDFAAFIHPDMVIGSIDKDKFKKVVQSDALAMFSTMRSFGGEPDGQLFEMSGRQAQWKNIMRLRNPDLGAHYHGHYGAWNEDVYLQGVTGDDHTLFAEMSEYPYTVEDSGLEILHFSDVRPYSRRLSRMKSCLENQGRNEEMGEDGANWLAENHPRVTLKDYGRYRFTTSEYPKEFVEARNQYRHLEKSKEAVPA